MLSQPSNSGFHRGFQFIVSYRLPLEDWLGSHQSPPRRAATLAPLCRICPSPRRYGHGSGSWLHCLHFKQRVQLKSSIVKSGHINRIHESTFKFEKKNDVWYVICDKWYMICNIWYIYITVGGPLTKNSPNDMMTMLPFRNGNPIGSFSQPICYDMSTFGRINVAVFPMRKDKIDTCLNKSGCDSPNSFSNLELEFWHNFQRNRTHP